uniref:C2H2-type domain-containing protein n=1 Tax=Timema monikensis TaxID=170555 RepID=A0A7R9E3N1_9NEOP|nr:unnamed protein product [Timema monikensis]
MNDGRGLLFSVLQIFMHKSAMQMHAREAAHRTEVKPHQCQQCLKSFSSNHQLVQHIRVHTGEKPYKCSYCDRRFKQLSHVQQHTRLHTAVGLNTTSALANYATEAGMFMKLSSKCTSPKICTSILK